MTPALRQPTFQQAMEITAQWLALWENGELSDEVLADRVAEQTYWPKTHARMLIKSLNCSSGLSDVYQKKPS